MALTAYAWDDAAGTVPLAWAGMDQPAAAQAAAAAPKLKAQPAGRRALFLWHDHPGLWWADGRSPRDMIAGGPFNLAGHRDWLRDVFMALALADAEPDLIVLDNESAPTLWAFPADRTTFQHFADIFADAECRAKLSADVLAFDAEDFAFGGPKYRAAVEAYGRWAREAHCAALRGVADVAARVFERTVPVVNWGDHASDTPGTDPNGWPFTRASVAGLSNPVLYMGRGGNLLAAQTKARRWNAFILALNNLRAACAGGGRVIPWVSFPSFAGDSDPPAPTWLWEQQVRHLAATGVGEVLYFNPASPAASASHGAAIRAWAAVKVNPTVRRDLPPIPYDADGVTTGSVTTTYAQFLAKEGAD